MPKPSPKKPDSLKLEFEPDAWARFESLVKSAAKMGHQPHKPSAPQPKRKAAVKRAKKAG